MAWPLFLLFGAIGGLVRGVFGAYKNSLRPGNGKKIKWKPLFFNIAAATIIGAGVGFIVDMNPITACIAGYAGIDIIESIFKLANNKK